MKFKDLKCLLRDRSTKVRDERLHHSVGGREAAGLVSVVIRSQANV
jgi:hypothetical protein